MNATDPYICAGEQCGEPIRNGQLYVEVRCRDAVDTDACVVMHIECLDALRATQQPAPTQQFARVQSRRLRATIEELLLSSREKSLAITKLDEFDMWIDRAIAAAR